MSLKLEWNLPNEKMREFNRHKWVNRTFFFFTVCNTTQPADIVFILDASGSIGSTDYQKMLSFVKRVLSGFNIGPQATQVGLITFDSSPYLQFYLNKYHTKQDVVKGVAGARYILY